jgi:hypothetical protein
LKIVLFDILKNSKKSIKIERYINTFGECIYVYINENIVLNDNIIHKLKNKIIEKHIGNVLNSKKFSESKYTYITSYDLDNNSILKGKLYDLLDDRFVEVIGNDTIKKNSIKYLQSYSSEAKILCIISEKIDITILLSYIEKFKLVDFMYIGKLDKNFVKNVNNVNLEYGSTVSFINSYDLTMYDVYVIFNKVDLDGYALNRKGKQLNLTSSDNDIYCKEYRIYNKYSNELINKENYSKTRIGKLVSMYLTNSV